MRAETRHFGIETADGKQRLPRSCSSQHRRFNQAKAKAGGRPTSPFPPFASHFDKPQSNRTLYDVAILGLGNFGAAHNREPLPFWPFLNDEIGYIRRDATNTLKQIGAGVAAN